MKAAARAARHRPSEFSKVVLALPASQFCVRSTLVRSSSNKKRTYSFSASEVQFEWDEREQLLHYQHFTASLPDPYEPHQIPWIVPSVRVGLDGQDRATNSVDKSASLPRLIALRSPGDLANIGDMNQPESCKSIVPHSTDLPLVSLLDAAPPVLTKAQSLLAAAASDYVNSSRLAKRPHSPSKSNCCLCCMEDSHVLNNTDLNTLKELQAFARNDVAEMSQPLWNGSSASKVDRKSLRDNKQRARQQARQRARQLPHIPEQPVALQMVGDDVREPNKGPFMSPSLLANASQYPLPLPQSPRHPGQVLGKLPMLVEDFSRGNNSAGTKAKISAELPRCYSEELKEKNREIKSLQATVYELVDYQEKIRVQFEKVKHHLCTEAQRRSSSAPLGPDDGPTLSLVVLDSTYGAALAAVDSFTNHFVEYSKGRSHVPADKIWRPNFENVHLAKRSHWTYALKGFFCEKMFVGFENESFMTDAASLYLDPAMLRKLSYDNFKHATGERSPAVSTDARFRTYCKQKFESIFPDEVLLETGEYDEDGTQRAFPTVSENSLWKSFTVAALKVWALHKLCLAFEPTANIYRIRRGLDVDWNYMESVVRLEDDERFIPNVGFMIAPGFHLRNTTVKSQIYLAGKGSSSNVDTLETPSVVISQAIQIGVKLEEYSLAEKVMNVHESTVVHSP